MQQSIGKRTFRDLDGGAQLPDPQSAIEEWYETIRDRKIEDMDVASLARACRQNLYIEEVVPVCINVLQQDPLAGEMYDGELVQVLKGLPKEYWASHPDERSQLLTLADRAYQFSGDTDLRLTENDLTDIGT